MSTDPPLRSFRWRRVIQFRLLTVLLLTMGIAAWLGWWTHTSRRQRDAVLALRKAGATSIRHGFEDQDLDAPPYWPTWIVDWLGVDFFGGVSKVGFHHEIADANLEHLKGIHSLQSLGLNCTEVTVEGVARLQQSLPNCYIAAHQFRRTTARVDTER